MPEANYAPDEVQSYLRDFRNKNQGYKFYDDAGLYKELKRRNIQGLPTWDRYAGVTKKTAKTRRKKDVEPTFVNSLYSMLDYGIDDNSKDWLKAAYNNSLTGMTEELARGKKRYTFLYSFFTYSS